MLRVIQNQCLIYSTQKLILPYLDLDEITRVYELKNVNAYPAED